MSTRFQVFVISQFEDIHTIMFVGFKTISNELLSIGGNFWVVGESDDFCIQDKLVLKDLLLRRSMSNWTDSIQTLVEDDSDRPDIHFVADHGIVLESLRRKVPVTTKIEKKVKKKTL